MWPTSPLELAQTAGAQCKRFLAHKTCTEFVDLIFDGRRPRLHPDLEGVTAILERHKREGVEKKGDGIPDELEDEEMINEDNDSDEGLRKERLDEMYLTTVETPIQREGHFVKAKASEVLYCKDGKSGEDGSEKTIAVVKTAQTHNETLLHKNFARVGYILSFVPILSWLGLGRIYLTKFEPGEKHRQDLKKLQWGAIERYLRYYCGAWTLLEFVCIPKVKYFSALLSAVCYLLLFTFATCGVALPWMGATGFTHRILVT
jgi:hypothetical protein